MKKYQLSMGFLVLMFACNLGVPTLRAESTTTPALLPTPIPATTTPTFVSPPTTAPAPPRFFADEFDFATPFWEFLQSGGSASPSTVFENGALQITIPTPDTWYVGIHNVHTYSNVFIRAKIAAGAAGSMGLICRYDASNGWYEFNIDSGGKYSLLLGQWLAPGIAKYISIAAASSSQIQAGNVNAEIGLFCEENILSLYVNETLLRRLDVTNYGLTEGHSGLAAASYGDAPLIAAFEWIKLSEK